MIVWKFPYNQSSAASSDAELQLQVSPAKNMNDWYKLETTEVLQHLGTNAAQGLAAPESARRLIEYGPNEFVERGKRSPWRILWEQLTATMVIILIVAAILSGALGAFKDTIAIATIVVLYALLGFIQEYRAEQ